MTRYEQGFMRKCAEYGVDYGMVKRALAGDEYSSFGAIDAVRDLFGKLSEKGRVNTVARQRNFNRDAAGGGIFATLGRSLLHPVRMKRYRAMRDNAFSNNLPFDFLYSKN